ncbi:hypothetical protein V8F20_005632 [Naviculisporaceae sp. PSN 640]
MDERNQSPTAASACFKCKTDLPTLAALEVHLRSCTTDWDPPRSVPWTFIPPPDSLGVQGPVGGDGRGRGGNRGRGSRRRGGADNLGPASGGGPHEESRSDLSQAEARGASVNETRGRGNSQDRGRGRGRGASNARKDTARRGSGNWHRGSTRAGRQKTDNPEANSARQRGGDQNPQGRRSSVSSSNSSQTSMSPGWAESKQPPERSQNVPSSDTARVGVTRSQQPRGPTCSKCKLSFANSQELVSHFNTSPAHPNSGFSPPSPSSTSTLPALQPRTPTSGPSHCTKCDIMFDCPGDLAAHFRESEDHPFILPIVGYRYGVPVFDTEFDPKSDMTQEGHEETTIRPTNYWYEDIEGEETDLVRAMRRFDLGR